MIRLHRSGRGLRRSQARPVLAIALTAAAVLAGAQLACADAPLLTGGPSGPTNDPTPTFAWSAAGAATCTIDGRVSLGCSSPWQAPEFADGPHVVEVQVGDQVEARTFLVDTIKPIVTADGDEAPRTEPVAEITFTTEAGAATTCAIDDGAYAPCTSPFTTPALKNGTRLVHVRATDAAGNVGQTERILQLAVTAPDTSIVAGPKEGEVIGERRPSFTFSATRPGSTFRCTIDGQLPFACGPTWAPSDDLATGAHTLGVAAVDAAGNADGSPAERQFSVVTCQQTLAVGNAVNVAAECLHDVGGGRYEATGPVKVNGLTFNPRGRAGNATIAIDTSTRVIEVRDVQLRMGSIVLYQGDLEFTVPLDETFTLANIDTDTKSVAGQHPHDTEGALDLTGDDDAQAAGLPIHGSAKLELSKGTAILTASIELPEVFTDAEGKGLTGQIKVTSSNAEGFKLAGAKVTAPLAFVGDVEVQNLSVAFIGDGSGAVAKGCNLPAGGLRWEGSASVLVFPAPGKPQLTDVGFGLADGRFAHAEGTLKPPAGGAELGAGVRLTKLSVALCAGPPVRLEGRAGLTALPGADGKPRLSIPDAGLIYQGAADGKPWTIRAEAPEAKITAGDIPITFSDLFLQVSGNGAVDFGGGVKFTVPLKGSAGPVSLDASVTVTATAKGFVQGSRYDAELSAKGCFSGAFEVSPAPKISFSDVCPQIDGLVSSKGFAVCGALTVGSKSIGRVGAGKDWDGDLKFMGSSCDVGQWRVPREGEEVSAGDPPPAAQAARLRDGQSPARRFEIAAGSRNVLVALHGAGGSAPPRATLVGPHGERIPTPVDPDATARTDASVAFTNRALATTYVGLRAPAHGTWTVETDPGTAAVGAIEAAPMLAPVRIRGAVNGQGRTRTVRFHASARRGQRITLVERGAGVAQTIAATTASSGTVAFHPASGPAGTRTIEALIEQDGLPRERRTVASYAAPGPQRPARPASVHLQRTAGGVRITWAKAARAARYGVRVETTDGRVQFLLRGAHVRSTTVLGVPRRLGVRVRVVGLLPSNAPGRAATAASPGVRRTTSSHGSHR